MENTNNINLSMNELDVILTSLVTHKLKTKSETYRQACDNLYHKLFSIYFNNVSERV